MERAILLRRALQNIETRIAKIGVDTAEIEPAYLGLLEAIPDLRGEVAFAVPCGRQRLKRGRELGRAERRAAQERPQHRRKLLRRDAAQRRG